MNQEQTQATSEASRCGSALERPVRPLVERLKAMAQGLDSETLREAADEIERLREALQAMVDCSHTMDLNCCARASRLAAAALKA